MNEFLKALDAGHAASIALSFNGARFIPGDDTLVVTFQPFTDADAVADADATEEFSPRAVWAEKFLLARGFSVLGINRQDNNWYRASDLHDLLRALQQQGFFQRYRRVMFYGGSMGGFAALTFAGLAPGCTVLAHNPQSTLRAADTPWETRFRVAQRQRWDGEFSDGAVGARAAARVYVSYDPFDRQDRQHIARLDPANLVPLRVPMVGHQMPVWLLQMKLLGAIFDAALAGSLDVASFRQMARARFELPHYLINLAARSRSPARQQYFGEKARGLVPQNPGPRDYLWSLASQRGMGRPEGITPLLIWTVDGCHGSDILAWIQALRPDARTALEPFSGPCKPHDLAVLFRKPSHGSMVRDEIQRLLTGSQVLLHRVAGMPTRFDMALMEAARPLGFNHLLLHRRDALARLRQVGATASTAPGDDAVQQQVAQARLAVTALASLQAAMQAHGDPYHLLALEVFQLEAAQPVDHDTRATLFRLLGVASDPQPPLPTLPRMPPPSPEDAVLREALAWLPTLDQGEAFLAAAISYPQQPACASVDPLLPVLREQDTLQLSGLALPPLSTGQFTQLVVEQGGVGQDARWGQPSPGAAARFPGRTDAGKARFGHVVLRVDSRQPIRLLLRQKTGQDSLEVARIDFQPLNRRRIAGLFLGPWGMGFKPIAGVASLALCATLHRLMSAHFGLQAPALAADEQQQHCERLCTDIAGAGFKFAVLREPLERFTTLWRRQLVEPRLRVPGLPTAPGVLEFIEHFDAYMRVPSLRACFESQAIQLVEPQGFAALYRLDDLAALQRDLQRRTGLAVTLPPGPSRPLLQRLGLSPTRLPAEAARWVAQRYADDVALWARLAH